MTKKKLIEKFNQFGCATEDDIKSFKHQLMHGSNHPFFAHGLGEYVGISSIHKVSKHYALAEISVKGTWMISKNTLKQLCVHQTNEKSLGLSEKYQKESNFSYVILHQEMVTLLPLLAKLDELVHTQDHVLIAMDGFSASGKTTLSKLLSLIYNAQVVHTDDFFKKPLVDSHDPLSIHGAHVDLEKIKTTILIPFMKKESFKYQPFDFRSHQHLDEVSITYNPFLIIEGAYSMHPKLEANYDYRLFVQVPKLKAYYRIFKRNGLKRLFQFKNVWMPKESAYVLAMDIKEKADLILKR